MEQHVEHVHVEHAVEHHEEKPLPGWLCFAMGVGFLALLAGGLVAVRLLS